MPTTQQVSQELAALYRAESTLMARAHSMRKEAAAADETGQHLRAAALRGKAVGLHQGAQQVASIAKRVREIEAE